MSKSRDSLMALVVSTFTGKGRRPAQEDYLLAEREKGIFVVADGFGGAMPGAQASKTACEAVRNFLFKEAGDLEATLPFVLRNYFSLPGNVLFNALIFANRKLNGLNRGKNVHERGGASVIAGFVDGDLLAIANVGVCTAWLFRDDKYEELVVPRSYGRLCNPFEPNLSQDSRVPLIALGMSEDLEPEIVEYRIKPGDWVAFATDGIVPEVYQKIRGVKQRNPGNEKAIQEISKFLDQSSFADNASLSLVIF